MLESCHRFVRRWSLVVEITLDFNCKRRKKIRKGERNNVIGLDNFWFGRWFVSQEI